MQSKLIYLILLIAALLVVGCDIRTPEIRGTVLDAATKQPVADAWIQFTVEVSTRTSAGGTGNCYRIEPPHTRSDKEGKFLVPAHEIEISPFYYLYLTKVEGFGLIADTIDDRIGGFGVDIRNYSTQRRRKFSTNGFDIKRLWWRKNKVDLTILLKPREDMNDYKGYYEYLQGLYAYCLNGRTFVEVPPVTGGCDEWELNYAIAKHENFLKRLGLPKVADQESYYVGTMKDLGYLYKRKRDYIKALEAFKKTKEFLEKINVKFLLPEYEKQIGELQELLRGHAQ